MNNISYRERIKNEIKFYEALYADEKAKKNLTWETPAAWQEVEKHVNKLIRDKTGYDGYIDYVVNVCNSKSRPIKILSLASGACGNEIAIANQLNVPFEFTCVDINLQILNLGIHKAKELKYNFRGLIQDINNLNLEPESYDFILAYASLHHFINLDHIAKTINLALGDDGEFITLDIPTRNGYRLWIETFEIIKLLWKILPEKYKIDHTSSKTPTYAKEYPDRDYSQNSFECIRSEEILPALNKHLKCKFYIPCLSISRRFFDNMFGFNFDLSNYLDQNVLNFILALDQYYIETEKLKPETFFGVYAKKKTIIKEKRVRRK